MKKATWIRESLKILFYILFSIILSFVVPLVLSLIYIRKFRFTSEWWNGYLFIEFQFLFFFGMWSVISYIFYDTAKILLPVKIKFINNKVLTQVAIGTITTIIFSMMVSTWIGAFGGPLKGYLSYFIFLILTAALITYLHGLIIKNPK